MITEKNASTVNGPFKVLRGLSTDSKPTDVANGSILDLMDTAKRMMFDEAGNQWREVGGITGGSGLPDVTSADNGKALVVDNGEWTVGEVDGLPPVSSADNGKVLKVNNGAWATEDNVFVIHATFDFVNHSVSIAESMNVILAALDAKKTVIMVDNRHFVFKLTKDNGSRIVGTGFYLEFTTTTNGGGDFLCVYHDGTYWKYNGTYLLIKPENDIEGVLYNDSSLGAIWLSIDNLIINNDSKIAEVVAGSTSFKIDYDTSLSMKQLLVYVAQYAIANNVDAAKLDTTLLFYNQTGGMLMYFRDGAKGLSAFCLTGRDDPNDADTEFAEMLFKLVSLTSAAQLAGVWTGLFSGPILDFSGADYRVDIELSIDFGTATSSLTVIVDPITSVTAPFPS